MHARSVQPKNARIALSLRFLTDRVAMGLLVGLSVILLFLARSDLMAIGSAGQRVGDFFVPVLQVINSPVVSVRNVVSEIGEILAIHEENKRLQAENRRLLVWQAEAVRLGVQNEALAELLSVPEDQLRTSWTTAQIVGDSGGPFVQTRLIDAGTNDEVQNGMAVVNERGLVGRIVGVGHSSSRLMLLTDFNSRVPVIVEGSRDRAILEGDNGGMPNLRFLPLNPNFAIGDRVLTSGDGGLLPRGLMIGEIASVREGIAEVAPYVDWSRLDYVSVLKRQPIEAPAPASSGQ